MLRLDTIIRAYMENPPSDPASAFLLVLLMNMNDCIKNLNRRLVLTETSIRLYEVENSRMKRLMYFMTAGLTVIGGILAALTPYIIQILNLIQTIVP